MTVLAVLVLLLSVGLGAAWSVRAYRNWERSRDRAQGRRECRSNLKAFFTAEKAYFQGKDAYLEDLSAIGFAPERGNRFVYVVSRSGPLEDRSGPALSSTGPVGIIGADENRHPDLSTKALLAKLPAKAAGGVEVGMSGQCPACEVVGMCVGNLDDHGAVEVWSIATFNRTLPDGGVVTAGMPHEDL